MTRINPLPQDAQPGLKDTLETCKKYLGYPPNSVLIMQRRPKLVKALAQMAAAVWDKESEVDLGFNRLFAGRNHEASSHWMLRRRRGVDYGRSGAAFFRAESDRGWRRL